MIQSSNLATSEREALIRGMEAFEGLLSDLARRLPGGSPGSYSVTSLISVHRASAANT